LKGNFKDMKTRFPLKQAFLLLPMMLLCPALLFADWQAFNPGLFTVLLPGSPRKINGILEWVATDPQKRAYNVTCKNLDDFPPDAREYFSQSLNDVVEGLHGRLEAYRFMVFEGNETCEFRITTPRHVVIGRMVLAKPYLYSLEVATGPKDFDADSAVKFFNSFKVSRRSVSAPDAPANNPPLTQPW
jgi:hypothetical protein